MNKIDVIYIEDNEMEAQIMQMGMQKWNVDILHIPGATQAILKELEQPRFQQAQAILFDSMLAGVNGWELARQMREHGDQRAFFLITAGHNPNPGLLNDLGIVYLQKPVDFALLADIIREQVRA
jgi:DNA-binding response OmpR family regulator